MRRRGSHLRCVLELPAWLWAAWGGPQCRQGCARAWVLRLPLARPLLLQPVLLGLPLARPLRLLPPVLLGLPLRPPLQRGLRLLSSASSPLRPPLPLARVLMPCLQVTQTCLIWRVGRWRCLPLLMC